MARSKKLAKPTIFMPIESTARELDYKLNLARFFCKEGHDVLVGNPAFIRDELKFSKKPAIFLEKGVNPDPKYYHMLSRKGVYLYDLGDEGASEPVYSINYQPAINSLKLMRKIFLWGEVQKTDLIKRNSDSVLSKKYVVIGNPGYDLCTPKYKPFNLALKPKGLPTSYILINTNFACVQSFDLEAHLQACNSISPQTMQMWEESYKLEEKQWPIFQRWLEDIIQAFPEEQFLLRPHPSEVLKKYEKIFGHYKNVVISKKGNVHYVTASAKLVLHKDCSTAMQAYLMGIPAISLGGASMYKSYTQWPLHFSALPKDLPNGKKLIGYVLKNGHFDPQLREKIHSQAKQPLKQYFNIIGNSTQALVTAIIEDNKNPIKISVTPNEMESRTFIQEVKFQIRKRLPLYYKLPIVARETMTEFSKEDILKRLTLLEEIDPLDIQYSVKKVFPNAYRISKKVG